MEDFQVQLLAREAGFVVVRSRALPQPWITGLGATDTNIAGMLMRFAELVAAAERQACARACRAVHTYDETDPSRAFLVAIDALGNEAEIAGDRP